MILKIGHFGKWIRNVLGGFNCGAEEGSKRSFASIVEKMKHYLEPRRKGTSYTQRNEKG